MATETLAPSTAERTVRRLLARADVEVNGSRPWDIQVHDDRLFSRVLAQGSLGLGEAFMDWWWDAPALDQCIERVLRARLQEQVRGDWRLVLAGLQSRALNRQSRHRAWEVNRVHYDLGTDLYERMLDPRMVYTCGYWEGGAETLAEAQEAKLDLICRKIGLRSGQRVLDIGCGFGGFAKFAAERYGARVVGITLAEEHAAVSRRVCAGLPVEIRIQDYRDLHDETFDHIVSIEMIEAVGYKNFRTYMKTVHRCLADDGFFLIQAIGSNTTETMGEAWMSAYIFPNGMLPSIEQIGRSIDGLFVMEDWHLFSSSYPKTLHAWHQSISARWGELPARYDERFRRMWAYYLLGCAGSFQARHMQLWQIVLCKHGVPGGYVPIR